MSLSASIGIMCTKVQYKDLFYPSLGVDPTIEKYGGGQQWAELVIIVVNSIRRETVVTNFVLF